MAEKPSIFTTPIEKPMLSIIADTLLSEFAGDPIGLSCVILLLPTRRAAEEMKHVFLKRAEGAPILIPQLHPIADVDADETLIQAVMRNDQAVLEAYQSMRPVISKTKQLLAITEQLYENKHRFDQLKDEMNEEQCLRMAEDIVAFMSECEREAVPFEDVLRLAPSQFAEHWQRQLEVLKFIMRWWPDYCDREGVISQYARRNIWMGMLADVWAKYPPDVPVIAAGSMGTQKPTAQLLSIIRDLPDGRIILPGLDINMGAETWEHVSPSHPQYHVKHLLESLQIERQSVQLLDNHSDTGTTYDDARILMDSCVPAVSVQMWRESKPDVSALTLKRIEARHEFEEVAVVVSLIKEALHQRKRVGVISHDAQMARHLELRLAEIGVVANNAQAKHMLAHPLCSLAMLMLDAAMQPHRFVPLFALLKHPLLWLMDDSEAQQAMIEKWEFDLRRKPKQPSVSAFLKSITENADAEVKQKLMALSQMLQQLKQSGGSHSLSEHIKLHRKAVDALVSDKAMLAELFDPLSEIGAGLRVQSLSQYQAIVKRLWRQCRYFPESPKDAPVQIMSPVEARLLGFDRIILSGLNEGEWPSAVADSPWLNAPLRKQVGLPDVQAHIGLEAHDWITLACHSDVYVTRSLRKAGAETIASRWLVRLDAMLGEKTLSTEYVDWLRQDGNVDERKETLAPAPNPPISDRPTSLPITQFDHLLSDPYSIYAKYILNLSALDDLDQELGAADMGKVLHKALELFVKRVNDDASVIHSAVFEEMLRMAFDECEVTDSMRQVWQPRMMQLSDWVVENERVRRETMPHVLAEEEIEGHFEHAGVNLYIRGCMDRLEHNDQQFSIIDYKSGSAPEPKAVKYGYAAQLPLSALMVQMDGKYSQDEVREVAYWKMGAGHTKPQMQSTDAEVVASYRGVIESVIERFYVQSWPYYASLVPKYASRHSDYGHLARSDVWLLDD
ncbi:MAG: PD-(D/E)XK nuclease family protein [Rickettsiales bacterium]|nr:PD-(D/E)XK nuclease family protein [Rickettsiales bacterium]